MPVALAILAAITGAYVWYLRAQNARNAIEGLADAAHDVRLAARRFGFKRQVNVHPAETVDDARLAAAGIVAAMAQMDRTWDKEMADAITVQAQSVFEVGLAEAEEMVIFGRWLAEQSSTKHEIVRRLAKQLSSLAGTEALSDLERMAMAVCGSAGALSEDVQDALMTVRRLVR